ncbi:MAG TPA: NUDIX hydrolase, partial [Acidimicrobiales bacterium]|nr:NUDIX hydrolase [Acidimicrobiales bacterium]
MRWTIHGERALYDSEWLRLVLVDIEVPDGERFDHHVVRYPQPAAGTIVSDPERGVLLIWRHRFITDTWGWEIPAGRIEPDESPEEAAVRETVEETGWR